MCSFGDLGCAGAMRAQFDSKCLSASKRSKRARMGSSMWGQKRAVFPAHAHVCFCWAGVYCALYARNARYLGLRL